MFFFIINFTQSSYTLVNGSEKGHKIMAPHTSAIPLKCNLTFACIVHLLRLLES